MLWNEKKKKTNIFSRIYFVLSMIQFLITLFFKFIKDQAWVQLDIFQILNNSNKIHKYDFCVTGRKMCKHLQITDTSFKYKMTEIYD